MTKPNPKTKDVTTTEETTTEETTAEKFIKVRFLYNVRWKDNTCTKKDIVEVTADEYEAIKQHCEII